MPNCSQPGSSMLRPKCLLSRFALVRMFSGFCKLLLHVISDLRPADLYRQPYLRRTLATSQFLHRTPIDILREAKISCRFDFNPRLMGISCSASLTDTCTRVA